MKITLLVIILLLNLGFAAAITQQEIKEAERLITSKASCNGLPDSQLELIGEYYMEQMHPGKAHEIMHQMMGLQEGSEAEEQFHIIMARRLYCNENAGIIGMMGGGMMNMVGMMNAMVWNGMGYGMMGNYGYGFGYWGFVNTLYAILIIGLIILVYLWIAKLWKDVFQKRR